MPVTVRARRGGRAYKHPDTHAGGTMGMGGLGGRWPHVRGHPGSLVQSTCCQPAPGPWGLGAVSRLPASRWAPGSPDGTCVVPPSPRTLASFRVTDTSRVAQIRDQMA